MIGENNFISKQIDTFRLITELSSGELNSTYKAEQIQPLPHIVVFKLFHSVHFSEIKRERFLLEIRLLKKVKHPHILPVLDGGFYEDSPYIVSEYAAHGSLRDRLNAQATQFLPMQEAIALISEVGKALQFFHQINIIHRNLKPENILFNEQGEILLADSSILTIEDSVPIEKAHNANSFPYMAPEQFHGRANKESDQYALGCIAYELLTGIAPFAGSAFKNMADMHRHEMLVPPTQLNMLLPAYLQEAMLKAMATQETNRYPHIKEFVAALTPAIKAQNVPMLVLSPTIAPIALPSHTQHEPPFRPQPESNSAVITFQDDKPPDTPALSTIIEDMQPAGSALQEVEPVMQAPTLMEHTDSPPDTPMQAVVYAENNEHLPQIETNEAAIVDSFLGYDTPTRPNLEVVLPQNNGVASANHLIDEVEQPHMVFEVAIPEGATQAGPYAWLVKNNPGYQLPEVKKIVLLVGISWAIVAVLILSMVFIIIPSAHTLSNDVSPIGQKATPHPTLQPTPTTHPTARPTAHPTPVPSPSPIPTPSPTATPTLTPSPSPITIPALTVSPTSLNRHTDCQSVQFGFKCTVTLLLPQNYPGNAHWTASASGNITAFFVPAQGILSPGQQQTVNIFVGKTCSHNGSFLFSTQNSKAVVSLSC